jgi:hypothetical protein
MKSFLIKVFDDGNVKHNCHLHGGAPQQAESALAALRGLGVEELWPGKEIDLRGWLVTPCDDGFGGQTSAMATSGSHPGLAIVADEVVEEEAT